MCPVAYSLEQQHIIEVPLRARSSRHIKSARNKEEEEEKIIKHMLHIACQDCAEFNKKWQSNGNKFCNFYTRFRESLKGRRRLSVGQIQCTPPMPLASQQALCIKRSANNADFVSY